MHSKRPLRGADLESRAKSLTKYMNAVAQEIVRQTGLPAEAKSDVMAAVFGSDDPTAELVLPELLTKAPHEMSSETASITLDARSFVPTDLAKTRLAQLVVGYLQTQPEKAILAQFHSLWNSLSTRSLEALAGAPAAARRSESSSQSTLDFLLALITTAAWAIKTETTSESLIAEEAARRGCSAEVSQSYAIYFATHHVDT